MKRPILFSAIAVAACLLQAASSSAQQPAKAPGASTPSFIGKWRITPLGGRGQPSTMIFQAGGGGTGYFNAAPTKTYPLHWTVNGQYKYVTWWLTNTPAKGQSRAFRAMWAPAPYSPVNLSGYACVVDSTNYNPTFDCDTAHRDYNFKQTPAK